MDIERSDIVISLSGRDKGKTFFVVEHDDAYAFLCDGKSRRVEKPKRKKLKHLRFQSQSDCRTAAKIRNGDKITNSEVRKALAEYALAEHTYSGNAFSENVFSENAAKSQGEEGGM